MTTETIANTVLIHTRKWIHPETGQVRHYINDWQAKAGLEVSHYNTGNISYAEYKGQKVSNGKASEFTGKAWVDEKGKVHLNGYKGRRLAERKDVLTDLQAAVDAGWKAED